MRNSLLLMLLAAALSNISEAKQPAAKPANAEVQHKKVVNSQLLLQLHPGMTRSQVRELLGAPVSADPAMDNHWDYVYELRKKGLLVDQRNVLLAFDNDILTALQATPVESPATSKPSKKLQLLKAQAEKDWQKTVKQWENAPVTTPTAEPASEAAQQEPQANVVVQTPELQVDPSQGMDAEEESASTFFAAEAQQDDLIPYIGSPVAKDPAAKQKSTAAVPTPASKQNANNDMPTATAVQAAPPASVVTAPTVVPERVTPPPVAQAEEAKVLTQASVVEPKPEVTASTTQPSEPITQDTPKPDASAQKATQVEATSSVGVDSSVQQDLPVKPEAYAGVEAADASSAAIIAAEVPSAPPPESLPEVHSEAAKAVSSSQEISAQHLPEPIMPEPVAPESIAKGNNLDRDAVMLPAAGANTDLAETGITQPKPAPIAEIPLSALPPLSESVAAHDEASVDGKAAMLPVEKPVNSPDRLSPAPALPALSTLSSETESERPAASVTTTTSEQTPPSPVTGSSLTTMATAEADDDEDKDTSISADEDDEPVQADAANNASAPAGSDDKLEAAKAVVTAALAANLAASQADDDDDEEPVNPDQKEDDDDEPVAASQSTPVDASPKQVASTTPSNVAIVTETPSPPSTSNIESANVESTPTQAPPSTATETAKPEMENTESPQAAVPAAVSADSQSISNDSATVATPQSDASLTDAVQPTSTPVEATVTKAVPAPTLEATPVDNALIVQSLEDWARAWRNKDIDAYFAAYAPEFIPDGLPSRQAWSAQRKQRLSPTQGQINLSLRNLQIERDGKFATVQFEQRYAARAYKDDVTKILQLRYAADEHRWLIVRERVLPSTAPVAAASQPMQDSSASDISTIDAAVKHWANAWRSKNIASYLACYASDFVATGFPDRKSWEMQRSQRISGAQGSITLELSSLKIKQKGNSAEVTFKQKYATKNYRDEVVKQLQLQLDDTQQKWLIVRETVQGQH